MNVLVIGQGGREHALVRVLRVSPSVTKVHALPGSDGIAQDAQCHNLSWEDFDAVLELIRREEIQLVVVGPEIPLAGGISDALRAKGIAVVGPSREAARLESSKVESKLFMMEAGVRTARFKIVRSLSETMAMAGEFSPPYVLKADGLAAGKGVYICKTKDELEMAARGLFVDQVLGEAGAMALLEEFQPGYEISYLLLTNGETFEPLILAQDHKRLNDGDQGPNTGGMGVVAPVVIDEELRRRIDSEVVAPVVAHLKKRNFLYRGVLYIGLMITEDGPSVLEFNVRFGDPEAQVILPLLDGDWGQVFSELAEGRLSSLRWKSMAAACVVLAAGGYPDRPEKDVEIRGLSRAGASDTSYLLHAGTRLDAQQNWVTAGGRVLNAVGLGQTLREAMDHAYAKASEIEWSGMQMRRDIGLQVLRSRAERKST